MRASFSGRCLWFSSPPETCLKQVDLCKVFSHFSIPMENCCRLLLPKELLPTQAPVYSHSPLFISLFPWRILECHPIMGVQSLNVFVISNALRSELHEALGHFTNEAADWSIAIDSLLLVNVCSMTASFVNVCHVHTLRPLKSLCLLNTGNHSDD